MNFVDLKPGYSVEGDEIKAFRSEVKSDGYIYLMAGVHGDEVEGVYALKQIFDWLKEEDSLSLPLIVIPVVNVDGHRHGTRTNAHGVDLNRNLNTENWTSEVRAPKYGPGPEAMSEPENQFLEKLFSKFKPKLILSLHSWKPILNYNGDCKDIAEFLSSFNNYPVQDDIGYPTPGSLGNYAPEKYNCPVLTFEFPTISDEITLKETWLENEKGFKELFQSELLQSYVN